MRTLAFTLLSLLCSIALAATVYRWVDEDGVVHYSDQPHANAEKVQVHAAQTYKPSALDTQAPGGGGASSAAASAPYRGCAIMQPQDGQAFANVDSLTVVVQTDPALHQGDRVYVSVGWGGGCDLLKIEPDGKKFKATAVYSQKEIGNKQGGVVAVDGHVYGYHEDRDWQCQELATGDIKWHSKRNAVGAGSLAAADGLLFLLSEKNGVGVVALLEASPEKYSEKGRFTLPKGSELRKVNGHVWTHPAIADGHLYLRDQELIFCYKIK